jgi:hypothetical protein
LPFGHLLWRDFVRGEIGVAIAGDLLIFPFAFPAVRTAFEGVAA